jgi:hypothetical protein
MLTHEGSSIAGTEPPRSQDLPSSFGFNNSLPVGASPLHSLLLQVPETPEAFSAAAAVRQQRLPVRLLHARAEEVSYHVRTLRTGGCLPIGIPSFTRLAIQMAGLPEPDWSAWPSRLAPHMLNPPRRSTAMTALRMRRPLTIGPLASDQFKEFLLADDVRRMSAQDLHHLRRLQQLPPTEPVLVRPVLDLAAEWRYYVLQGDVIGFAPCEGSTVASARPDLVDVSAIVAATPGDAAYAMDVGVLASGGATLLRVHDPLRVELIPTGPNRPSALNFLRMQWTRWQDLLRYTTSRA